MNNLVTAALVASAVSGIAATSTTSGQVFAASNSDLSSAHRSEEISNWITGCPAINEEETLESLVPHIEVGRRFDYWTNDGSVMTETDDSDIRAPHGSFKVVNSEQGSELQGKTFEKGLGKCIDHSLIGSNSSKEKEIKKAVLYLRKRLARIELFRFYKLMDSVASTVSLTWGGASDPDTEIQVQVGDDACRPDSLIISRSASMLRKRVYRQKDIANISTAQNALFTDQELADYLDIDSIHKDKSYIQTGKKKIKNKMVATTSGYLYNKGSMEVESADEVDNYNPSSVAKFWTPFEENPEQGGRYGVLIDDSNPRLTFVYVVHYSQFIALNASSVKKLNITDDL